MVIKTKFRGKEIEFENKSKIEAQGEPFPWKEEK